MTVRHRPSSKRRRAHHLVVGAFLVGTGVTAYVVATPPSQPVEPAAIARTTGAAELAAAVEEHLGLVQGQGKDAQAALDTSLEALQQRGDDAFEVTADLYQQADVDDYMRRWSLVDLMGELRSPGPEATAALGEIARAPLPAERGRPFDEEAMIRLRAIEALTARARVGDDGARDALRQCVTACPPAVKPSAVHAALMTMGPTGRDEIARDLGPDEAWMLDLRLGDLATDGAIAPPAADDKPGRKPPRDIPAPTS